MPSLFRWGLVNALTAAALGVAIYAEAVITGGLRWTPFGAAGWLMGTGVWDAIEAFKKRAASKRLIAKWRENIRAATS